jgi:hypothetical protein
MSFSAQQPLRAPGIEEVLRRYPNKAVKQDIAGAEVDLAQG